MTRAEDRTMDAIKERTVDDISNDELLKRAVRSMANKTSREYLWVRVMDAFALGSTFSHQLCRRYGFDPDQKRRIKTP